MLLLHDFPASFLFRKGQNCKHRLPRREAGKFNLLTVGCWHHFVGGNSAPSFSPPLRTAALCLTSFAPFHLGAPWCYGRAWSRSLWDRCLLGLTGGHGQEQEWKCPFLKGSPHPPWPHYLLSEGFMSFSRFLLGRGSPSQPVPPWLFKYPSQKSAQLKPSKDFLWKLNYTLEYDLSSGDGIWYNLEFEVTLYHVTFVLLLVLLVLLTSVDMSQRHTTVPLPLTAVGADRKLLKMWERLMIFL